MQDLQTIQQRNAAFVIMSPERSHLDAVKNAGRVGQMKREIANLTDYFKPVDGFFDSEHEQSFLISVDHGHMDINAAIEVAQSFDQDSVLVLGSMQGDGSRPAQIVQCSDPSVVESIGNFKPVSRDYAHLHSAYTFDPENERYFVAE